MDVSEQVKELEARAKQVGKPSATSLLPLFSLKIKTETSVQKSACRISIKCCMHGTQL